WDSDPDAARQTLVRTQELTRTGLNEARRAVHALRSRPVDELGLVLALRRLAESAAQRAGLRLMLDLPEQVTGIQPEVEQQIYRIAEEALNNVVRHAQAQRLYLRLRRDRHTLHLTITDDGIGFDAALGSPDGHFGLTGMQERALLIDGDLIIQSLPDRGTQVRLCIERQPMLPDGTQKA
ncbi:MAG: sensor histidine kinase, partial [Chloroflexi bacterium]|nr:sensor histidine kinase [Chloroflexota bacterium]